MSKLETPMTRRYWEQVGGTLIEEFLAVKGTATCGPRRLDAVVPPDYEMADRAEEIARKSEWVRKPELLRSAGVPPCNPGQDAMASFNYRKEIGSYGLTFEAIHAIRGK